MLALGGDGIISVASNQVPDVMAKLCAAAFAGDWETARALHFQYLDLMRVNFIAPNPVPVKAAMAEMGLIHDVLRQPLLPMAEEQRPRLRAALRGVGLLADEAATAAVPA
jgi:4-hydroxy-tetrahydrodipicolinate synthase